jgi:hypothetical protein
MTKHLLAGVAAAILVSGVASAQIYAPAPAATCASAASRPRPRHDDYHDRYAEPRRQCRDHDP